METIVTESVITLANVVAPAGTDSPAFCDSQSLCQPPAGMIELDHVVMILG